MKKMTITLSMLVVVALGSTKMVQSQISTQLYQADLVQLGINHQAIN